MKEIMFDDDTFTDSSNLARVEAISTVAWGSLGMTWSCNVKANRATATQTDGSRVVIGRL